MTAGVSSFWRLPTYIDNRVLAADTAESIARPSGYNAALITADVDCWIRRSGTAAAPSADVTDGTGSALVSAGVGRLVDFGTATLGSPSSSISIIAAEAANVSIEWFA